MKSLLGICTFFGVVTLGAHAVASARQPDSPPRSTVASPQGSRELTADQQVTQVLNRLAFGPRPGEALRVRQLGVDQWIAQQLQPAHIDDRATEQLLSRFETLDKRPSELLRAYPPPQALRARRRQAGDTGSVMSAEDSAVYRMAAQQSGRVGAELSIAKVARATASERQLQEVMVDFWENHFSIFIGKGPPERYFLAEFDRDVIRPRTLGKFRDLLGAVAHSPAMLFYLDNWQSIADSTQPTLLMARGRGQGQGRGQGRGGGNNGQPPASPRRRSGLNENYARELLELHTLGVDGGYTQQDVINVARALTGWTIRAPQIDGEFLFRPDVHDAGEKKVLGHVLRGGRGIVDGEDVLDIVARHPATARYIATKLARRFVSDSPSPALIDRAAAVFQKTDGDIREVVRSIVTSPEFFSRAAYRTKVKSPFELVVSALRVVGAAPDTTPRSAQLVGRLGQPMFGHQAPNGYPETSGSWMNTGAILNRINFGIAVAAGRIPGASLARWPAAATLYYASREAQVDGVIAAVLAGEASPDTRAVLLSGEHPFLAAARSTDSLGLGTDPTGAGDMMGRGRGGRVQARADERDALQLVRPAAGGQGPTFGPLPPLTGLAQVLGLALGSPEFQRR